MTAQSRIPASTPEAGMYYAAEAAAIAACAAEIEREPENPYALDCGFGWVVVKPARGAFINWCRKNGKGRKEYGGGWCFWNPGHTQTQAVRIAYAGAKAFAESLQQHGVYAEACSRLD